MASKDLTYTVGVDASDAVSGLRKLESAVRSTMRDVESELDEGATAGDKLAASLDRVAAQTKEDLNSAAIAAEELQRALKDAGSGLNVGDALTSLSRMGLSFDEITQDADKLAVSLKQLDDVRVAGVKDLDGIAPGLATKLDDVSKSADSSKSALANMVGNSTQSMGQLVGISGDLGVGIGQIGEYFADAAFSGEGLASVFKSMAGVVGPMAALGLATSFLSSAMEANAKSAEASTKRVEMMSDAMREGGDATKNYAKALAESEDAMVATGDAGVEAAGGLGKFADWIPILGDGLDGLGQTLGVFGEEQEKLTDVLHGSGIQLEQWSRIVTAQDPQTALQNLETFLHNSNLKFGEQRDILHAAQSAQEEWANAKDNASLAEEFFGTKTEDTTKTLEEQRKELEDNIRASREHAVALADATGQLLEMSSTFAEIGRRGDAISAVFDLGNAPLDAASATRDIAEAIGGLGEAAKGVKVGDILAGNMKGDAVLDALDGLRPQIQAKVAEAFSAGGPEAAQSVADDYVAQIVAGLGGKLTAEQVTELLGLSDLSATIAVALDMSTAARVKSQLDVLTGLNGTTPFTAAVQLALDAGTISPEAAEVLVRQQLATLSIPLPTDVTPPTPEQLAEAGAFATSFFAAQPPKIPTSADPQGFASDVGAAKDDAEAKPATIPLEADPKRADTEAQGVKSKAEALKPVVPIDSDTKAAIATMMYLRILAALLAPEVRVTADISSAMASLAIVASQRPRVPVEAYLSDYPTSSEIAARIGRPRIPVDIVVGQSIRITGVRE